MWLPRFHPTAHRGRGAMALAWGLVGRDVWCGAAKAHCCVAVDESRSSLAARCVSFYQIVCLSLSVAALSGDAQRIVFAQLCNAQLRKRTRGSGTGVACRNRAICSVRVKLG